MIRHLRVTVNGKSYDVTVEELAPGAAAPVTAAAPASVPTTGAPAPAAAPAEARPVAPGAARPVAGGPDALVAPLGGIIVAISVAVGDAVAVDQPVAVLEAMKMQTVISAHKAGRVTAIHVGVGDGVDVDQPLLSIA
jgi:biotin carboxyl carrier protein